MAYAEKYIHGIEVSPMMAKFRGHVPRLRFFLTYIQDQSRVEKLDDHIEFGLAQNNLHFLQFLIADERCKITGISD